MQDLIFEFGQKRIQDNDIIKNRLYFNISNGNVNEENIVELAKKEVQTKLNIDFDKMSLEIIQRENPEGFYLNWHIDDCAIYKHNSTEQKTNNIPLDEKYSLYHKKKLPKYTMIIYLTSIDEDFVGGEFEFVNMLVRPKKYDVLFFDSREVHRVRRFRGGIRKNILIKFFEEEKIEKILDE